MLRSFVPCNGEIERHLVRVPALFAKWKERVNDEKSSKELFHFLGKVPELELVYDPLIAQAACGENSPFIERAEENANQRLQKVLPGYAAFSKASANLARGKDEIALQQLLSLKEKGCLQKGSLLYYITIAQILALEEKLHILPHSTLPPLEALLNEENGEGEAFIDLLGRKNLSSYLQRLETKAAP